jgi:N-acetylneuraminate synthase
MPNIKILDRDIGDGFPPVVIAEIGINHGGSLEVALEMATAAIDAGAEIVKHQTHVVSDEMSEDARNVIPANDSRSIFEIMESCALSEDDEWKLYQHVKKRGAKFISTPFSRAAADRLAEFDVPAFKIGSGECNNYPLIEHVARFGKPVIVSTGMNSIESIGPTVDILRKMSVPYALLQCTNVYPTPPEYVRLGGISELREAFQDAVIGLSDHSESIYPCLGAVAYGASILERHFTDRRSRKGPDIKCSMNPEELGNLIDGANIIFLANSKGKGPIELEGPTIAFAFASVVAIRNIKAGDKLTRDNIWVKRPGGGDFLAKDFEALVGATALMDIEDGRQIKKTDVSIIER